jgi:hypothetical protein
LQTQRAFRRRWRALLPLVLWRFRSACVGGGATTGAITASAAGEEPGIGGAGPLPESLLSTTAASMASAVTSAIARDTSAHVSAPTSRVRVAPDESWNSSRATKPVPTPWTLTLYRRAAGLSCASSAWPSRSRTHPTNSDSVGHADAAPSVAKAT